MVAQRSTLAWLNAYGMPHGLDWTMSDQHSVRMSPLKTRNISSPCDKLKEVLVVPGPTGRSVKQPVRRIEEG